MLAPICFSDIHLTSRLDFLLPFPSSFLFMPLGILAEHRLVYIIFNIVVHSQTIYTNELSSAGTRSKECLNLTVLGMINDV
jgi:hypothetical protein